MEMWRRKYMFCDKSIFGSSQNGQNMPKKVNKKKYFLYIKQVQEWFRVWN